MTNTELKQVAIDLVGEDELARLFHAWISGVIRKARLKRSNIASGTLYDDDAARILEDLNQRSKSRYQLTDHAKGLIISLLKKGYQPEDFYRVHEAKCTEWLGNPAWEHNLRPSTLYRPSHFDEYLAQWHRDVAQRAALAKKRAASSGSKASQSQLLQAENTALIQELSSRPWHSFESFIEFMLWTSRFPTLESREAYPMPESLRTARKTPGMLMHVAKRSIPAWAESQYLKLKKEQ